VDKHMEKMVAAGVVICIGVLAVICITVILVGSFVYLGGKPAPEMSVPVPAQAPEVTEAAAPSPTPLVSTVSTAIPIQVLNPFIISDVTTNNATGTCAFSLSLDPGAHPAELMKISVNATHADKDYGTVWRPSTGPVVWTNKATPDNGALNYGDILTITINLNNYNIPIDGKHIYFTIMYDGNAAETIDINMSPAV